MAADRLIERLMDAGLSEELVSAALPEWWTQEERGSSSAKTMVSLLLARRLSLDPETLLDDNVPVGFLHTGPTKFKHMRLVDGGRKQALVAFAQGVSRILLATASITNSIPVPANPLELRAAILSGGRPFVSFGDVLAACWSLGVPVLHLRLFPAQTKGVTAIAVRLGARHAILVARESGYEAQYMFHVAHELGHIALGHLKNTAAIVDADPLDPENLADELIHDEEECAADQYAQALLSGIANFSVERANNNTQFGTARELADIATRTGAQLGIDPSHIVLSFAYSSSSWGLAMAALKHLPQQSEKPGTLTNRVLWQQLVGAQADDPQSLAYLQAVAPI